LPRQSTDLSPRLEAFSSEKTVTKLALAAIATIFSRTIFATGLRLWVEGGVFNSGDFMRRSLIWSWFALALVLPLTGCEDSAGIEKISTGTLALAGEFRFSKTSPGTHQSRTVSMTNVGKERVTLAQFSKQATAELVGAWSVVGADGKVVDSGDKQLPPTIHLAPGEALRLSLTYAPKSPLPPTGTVMFRSNSGVEGQREMSLPIGGLVAVGELHITPNPVQFGRVTVGDVSRKTVTLTNFGTDTIRLNKLAVHGSSNFSVRLGGTDPIGTPEVLNDPDGDGAPGLKPDGQVEIEIIFRPSSDHSDMGELQINSDAHNAKVAVALLGNAAAPCVRVMPNPIAFGATAIGAERMISVRIESCGAEAVTVQSLALSTGSEGYRLDIGQQLPIQLPGTTSADFQSPGVDIQLFFKPTREAQFEGHLLMATTDSERPEMEIEITGSGVENQCPTPRITGDEMNVRPLDVVILDGSSSTDPDGPNGQPVEYKWFVVDRPLGSTSVPVESLFSSQTPADGGTPDVTSTPTARFFVDLAGEYTIELRVVDHYGATAPSELCPTAAARRVIKAVPNEALHIQLTWDTPGDADQTDDQGTDVDLHLRHPESTRWSQEDGADCFYQNRTPDWGRAGQSSDDPSLDIDDVNGAGPENINIERPETTAAYGKGYLVGVHYYSAERLGGAGEFDELESTARIRIFVDGAIAYEGERLLRATNDFWTVAEVHFAEAGGRVAEVNTLESLFP
jgi:hypothetical protein